MDPRTKKYLLILILIEFGLTMPATSTAQTLKDKIFVSHALFPSTGFKRGGGESEWASALEIQIGPPPFQLNPRWKWINTITGRVNQYNFADLNDAYATTSSTLYDVQYGVIFIYDLQNPQWSLFSSSNLLLRSDFSESITSKSLFFSGLLMANYNPDGDDQLVWSFGVALSNDFNRNIFIPIVGLTYNNSRYTVEIAYPRVNFLYKPRPQIEWGITTSILGGIYKTESLLLPSREISKYTRTITVQVGHTFNYLLSDNVVLNTCVGYAFVRNYDLMNEDFNNIQSVNLDLNGSLFLRTGVAVRF